MGTASAQPAAAAPVKAMEPGCAKLGNHGPGWADIHNVCGHTISAGVEVDGWDPSCIRICPTGSAGIGLEAGETRTTRTSADRVRVLTGHSP